MKRANRARRQLKLSTSASSSLPPRVTPAPPSDHSSTARLPAVCCEIFLPSQFLLSYSFVTTLSLVHRTKSQRLSLETATPLSEKQVGQRHYGQGVFCAVPYCPKCQNILLEKFCKHFWPPELLHNY